jgi:NADH-quinone oxidoreductase subunit D
MHYTHAFVGAVERAAKIEVPPRAEYARVITSELNRISSHLVWWGALLLDLGGFTPILYAFDDREKILDLLEGLCGARLTYCYYRFGGLYNDVDDAFLKGHARLRAHMRPRLKMYRDLVTDNIILRQAPHRHRPDQRGHVPQVRRHRAGDPRLRGRLRCASRRAVFGVSDSSTSRSRPIPKRFHGALPRAHGRDGAEPAHHRAGARPDPGRAVHGKVPRVLKLPPGDTCYAVEAARGRFMVRIVSDGKDHALPRAAPHPSFSNLSLFEEASRA